MKIPDDFIFVICERWLVSWQDKTGIPRWRLASICSKSWIATWTIWSFITTSDWIKFAWLGWCLWLILEISRSDNLHRVEQDRANSTQQIILNFKRYSKNHFGVRLYIFSWFFYETYHRIYLTAVMAFLLLGCLYVSSMNTYPMLGPTIKDQLRNFFPLFRKPIMEAK